MIAVTLSAPDDWNDHRAMLDFGFSKYTRLSIAEPGDVYYDVPVTGGTENVLRITNKDSLSFTVPKDHAEVKCVIEAPRFIIGPVSKDSAVGYARYFMGDDEIGVLPLYATAGCDSYPSPSILDKFINIFR
jgi:D-alanyl-D-alanine carboxypeptidase